MQHASHGRIVSGDPLHYERVAFGYLCKAAEIGEFPPTEVFYLDPRRNFLIRSITRIDGQDAFLSYAETALVTGMIPAYGLYVIERLEWEQEFLVERSRLVEVGALLPGFP